MASSPEPAPGQGAFIVVNGSEDECRPEAIRNFFHEQIGACRIVTSSRSYSNEKTFVTLEFHNRAHVTQAIDRYNSFKVNGCHTNVALFKSRNGQGGGSRGNQRYSGNDGQQGNWNNRAQFPAQRRGRSFGDMQGERMRGMSPNAAARFIEQRLEEKERRQSSAYHDGSGPGPRSPSYSRSRSRSLSASRSTSSSRSRRYWRSPSNNSQSRCASRSRSPLRSPTPPRNKRHSRSPSRSHSKSCHSPTSDHVVDEITISDDEERSNVFDHSDSDSGRAKHRRSRRRRKHHRTRPPTDDNESDQGVRAGSSANEPVCTVEETENTVLELAMPGEGLSTVSQKLLSAKREGLEQEFKADVSTIMSVTKLLIAQDTSLQTGVQTALKGCIRDISQRYVAEFQAFTKDVTK